MNGAPEGKLTGIRTVNFVINLEKETNDINTYLVI